MEEGQLVVVNEDGKKVHGVVDGCQIVDKKISKVVVKITDREHPKYGIKVAFNPDQVTEADQPKAKTAKGD